MADTNEFSYYAEELRNLANAAEQRRIGQLGEISIATLREAARLLRSVGRKEPRPVRIIIEFDNG